jgi:hypothetical protein
MDLRAHLVQLELNAREICQLSIHLKIDGIDLIADTPGQLGSAAQTIIANAIGDRSIALSAFTHATGPSSSKPHTCGYDRREEKKQRDEEQFPACRPLARGTAHNPCAPAFFGCFLVNRSDGQLRHE